MRWPFNIRETFSVRRGTQPGASVIINCVDRQSGRHGGAAVCQCVHHSPPAPTDALISVK